MAPGMPNTAARIGDGIGHIMNYGDGWYGGVYMGTMYSLAFVSDDIRHVGKEALKTIPSQSTFHQCIADVIRWHAQYPDDWKQSRGTPAGGPGRGAGGLSRVPLAHTSRPPMRSAVWRRAAMSSFRRAAEHRTSGRNTLSAATTFSLCRMGTASPMMCERDWVAASSS